LRFEEKKKKRKKKKEGGGGKFPFPFEKGRKKGKAFFATGKGKKKRGGLSQFSNVEAVT